LSTPLLHVLAGPNGSGKSAFVHAVLGPATGLPFINADEIAAARWPGDEAAHAYDASRAAAAARAQAIAERRSFITETVFSHPSKVSLVEQAVRAGYRVELHVMLIPEDVTVARVAYRVSAGGHAVPHDKIRERYQRLWGLVARARPIVHRATFYDNSRSEPFRLVAVYERGHPVGVPAFPSWTPEVLRVSGGR
jgi:predicted ABC-type ATPase